MVKVKMVKIDFGNTVIAHYNINNIYYLYYSGRFCQSVFDFDQNDHDHFDHAGK